MKFNMMPIMIAFQKIANSQKYKDMVAVATPVQRRNVKDKLVYRLMFAKKRTDDINDTDDLIEALNNEEIAPKN